MRAEYIGTGLELFTFQSCTDTVALSDGLRFAYSLLISACKKQHQDDVAEALEAYRVAAWRVSCAIVSMTNVLPSVGVPQNWCHSKVMMFVRVGILWGNTIINHIYDTIRMQNPFGWYCSSCCFLLVDSSIVLGQVNVVRQAAWNFDVFRLMAWHVFNARSISNPF